MCFTSPAGGDLLFRVLVAGYGEERFALAQEQGEGSDAGQNIGDGLGDEDAEHAAGDPGQDQGQGDQQDHLAQKGEEEAGACPRDMKVI